MSHLSLTRRETVMALLSGAATAAAAPALAQQAEWRQNYDAGPRNAVLRSHTPMLSPESLQATEQAIAAYRDLAARGAGSRFSFPIVSVSAPAARPSSPCASASPSPATCSRLPARATSTIPMSRPRCASSRPASACRRQARSTAPPSSPSTSRSTGASASSRPTSSACAPGRAISAAAMSSRTSPPRWSRRSRTAMSRPATPPASARSTASRRCCRPRFRKSISTRPGRCPHRSSARI